MMNPANSLIYIAANGGQARTEQTPLQTLCLTFLAGAYIALGGVLAVRCAFALDWMIWGSLSKFIFAAVFPLGLMLVIFCGADLFTGNCMTLGAARFNRQISPAKACLFGLSSWCGNFLGALFVAYCVFYLSGIAFETARLGSGATGMPWADGLVKLANGKVSLDFWPAFWRGVACNWLVSIAVYAAFAAKDAAGKFIALWFPTMAFVAMGMEHCVANMFFVPAAIFTGSDPRYLALVEKGLATPLTADWSSFFLSNLPAVTLGNIAGGALLVSGLYFLAYARKA